MISRYYATGTLQKHISSIYRISKCTFRLILKQVSFAIIKELKTEFMEINTDNWINVANDFNYKWQLPHCLGAIDGHVAIKKPTKSGSEYYN